MFDEIVEQFNLIVAVLSSYVQDVVNNFHLLWLFGIKDSSEVNYYIVIKRILILICSSHMSVKSICYNPISIDSFLQKYSCDCSILICVLKFFFDGSYWENKNIEKKTNAWF